MSTMAGVSGRGHSSTLFISGNLGINDILTFNTFILHDREVDRNLALITGVLVDLKKLFAIKLPSPHKK